MLLRGERKRVRAVLMATVIAMAMAAPAGAVSWGERGESLSEILSRVFTWLNLSQAPAEVNLKCDFGSSIDPNGCPKKKEGERSDSGKLRQKPASITIPGRI